MWQQREKPSSKFNQDISKSGYFGASSWPRPTQRESGIRAQAWVQPPGGSVKMWSDARGNRATPHFCLN
jgi:hypothetical protein